MNIWIYSQGQYYPFAKELVANLIEELNTGVNMIRFCSFTKVETFNGDATINLDGRIVKMSAKELADLLQQELDK